LFVVVFQGTLPVLIKQIYRQKDDIIKSWGFEYKMITAVAIVRNIDHSSTKITYALEDITGEREIRLTLTESKGFSLQAASMLISGSKKAMRHNRPVS
jgi:replication factor A2